MTAPRPQQAPSFRTLEDLQKLGPWLQQSQQLAARVSALPPTYNATTLNPLHAEPTKRTEGMLVYADGTDWNPGFGAGSYIYVGGAWLSTTLPNVLPVVRGGTSFSTYAIGDILYASGASAFSKLAGVATGNALISGGVATAPAWGKIGLTTHVSGTLPLANGGTNATDAAGARTSLGLVIGTDVQAFDATLSALAGADWVANAVPIGSGANTVSQVSFAANTFPARSSTGDLVAKPISDFGLSLVDDADASAGRATLGLGTASTQNTGTSGANVPLLNGANTWSAAQTFTAKVGYGSGGAVTQATDKTTGVTLNTISGAITLDAAALLANATATFTLTNSEIAADDVLILSHKSVGIVGDYVFSHRCAAGSASICVRNVSAGSLSEAIVIQFAVIRGAIA